jgi:hypothetical protein
MEEFRHWRHLCLICGEHFASGLFLDMVSAANFDVYVMMLTLN